MKTKIFNAENTVKTNVIRSVIGLLITILSITMYCLNYTQINVEQFLEFEKEIIFMFISVLSLLVGTALIISVFNLYNTIVRVVLAIVLVLVICAAFIVESIGVGVAILVMSLVIFILTKIFDKFFSTIITFSVSCLAIIPFLCVCTIVLQLPRFVSLYTSISVMLLLYNIFGVKLNQWCLNLLNGGYMELSKKFNYNELKNQINFLYLVLFVALNLSIMYNEHSFISTLANSINNALITGVCITNVNWKVLFLKNIK